VTETFSCTTAALHRVRSQSAGLLVLTLLFASAPLLLGQMNNRLPPNLPPEIHAWFGRADFYAPEGYRAPLDVFADHSNFGMLTTSIRSPEHEIVLPGTHDQVKRAVEYAHRRGIQIALDLDIRLARAAFQVRHPDQQQWMLCLRSFALPLASAGRIEIEPAALRDHMGQYQVIEGRLMRVWTHDRTGVRQVKEGCRASEEPNQRVAVTCASEAVKGAAELIVAAAFEYRTPDVFAPDFLAFQNEILAQYRDIPLDGTMKDEWGFPPVGNQGAKDGDFWYSKSFATEYAKSGGGEFLDDCLLMWLGAGGAPARRIAAVNRYMRLILDRNATIEQDFYATSKRIFGPRTFVAVHATWGVMPFGDAFKNGYDWWQAKRDYGQTDEHWPLPVRTSLAHKMGKPVWYNQFYAGDAAPYAAEVWRNARAGGRVNFHPLYGARSGQSRQALLQSPAMKAENRVRLLNFITEAPLDCPVAVVFGHAAALNWVGRHFGDLGVEFAEDLWDRGIPTDVIPSTEIESGALKIAADGSVVFGTQRYRALIFVNPDYEPAGTFAFLRRVAASKTTLFIRGRAETGWDGDRLAEGETNVPGAHADPTPSLIAEFLWKWHTPRRTMPLDLAKLTDGTCILARGDKDPAGDEIQEDFTCGQTPVHVEATGVIGIRMGQSGELQALAASSLRRVDAGNFHLKLSSPADLALWRTGGELHGVVQGVAAIPAELQELTKDWLRLDVAPFPEQPL
jgi:hypothetical protein